MMPDAERQPNAASLPPAIVINLDRSPGRLERVTSAFSAAGIALQRFSAVDAKADREASARTVHDRLFYLFNGRAPLIGEIGCALSHFAVWDSLAARPNDVLLVVEDDALPDPLLANIPLALKALPDDWEILLLAENLSRWPVWKEQAGALSLTRYFRPGYLTVGYLVHRRILKRRHLWNRPRPVRFPVDRWRFWWMWHGLAVYVASPSTVHPPVFGADGPLLSTIAETDAQLRKPRGWKVLPHRLWGVPIYLAAAVRFPCLWLHMRLHSIRRGAADGVRIDA